MDPPHFKKSQPPPPLPTIPLLHAWPWLGSEGRSVRKTVDPLEDPNYLLEGETEMSTGRCTLMSPISP